MNMSCFPCLSTGGTIMSCARTVIGTMVIRNKLHDLMMALSLSNGRQMPSDSLFIM